MKKSKENAAGKYDHLTDKELIQEIWVMEELLCWREAEAMDPTAFLAEVRANPTTVTVKDNINGLRVCRMFETLLNDAAHAEGIHLTTQEGHGTERGMRLDVHLETDEEAKTVADREARMTALTERTKLAKDTLDAVVKEGGTTVEVKGDVAEFRKAIRLVARNRGTKITTMLMPHGNNRVFVSLKDRKAWPPMSVERLQAIQAKRND